MEERTAAAAVAKNKIIHCEPPNECTRVGSADVITMGRSVRSSAGSAASKKCHDASRRWFRQRCFIQPRANPNSELHYLMKAKKRDMRRTVGTHFPCFLLEIFRIR